MDWPACLRAAVWPIGWLVVMLVSGALTGWYPYPFLDHRVHGWDHVAIVCAGIFVLFFGLFAVLARVRPSSLPRTGHWKLTKLTAGLIRRTARALNRWMSTL